MILERIESFGVPVSRVVCAGGIAEKNPMLMQIYADITGREMFISGSSQTCALGSAVSAAVLAGSALGGYDDFETAQAKMTRLKDVSYQPNPDSQTVYDELFELYKQLHDAFGGVVESNLGGVMKDLLKIKDRARR